MVQLEPTSSSQPLPDMTIDCTTPNALSIMCLCWSKTITWHIISRFACILPWCSNVDYSVCHSKVHHVGAWYHLTPVSLIHIVINIQRTQVSFLFFFWLERLHQDLYYFIFKLIDHKNFGNWTKYSHLWYESVRETKLKVDLWTLLCIIFLQKPLMAFMTYL